MKVIPLFLHAPVSSGVFTVITGGVPKLIEEVAETVAQPPDAGVVYVTI
jgi:hypothetical protein